MDKQIQILKQQNNWQSQFQDFNLKNNLSNNSLGLLQHENIDALMKHLLKISQEKHPKHQISWVSTQYQILEIVLNSTSVITSKIVEDFASPEWQSIYQIFPYKQPLTIKYESIRMVQEKKQHRRRWSSSEQNFLIEIVKKSLRKNKWNDVARQLFIKSEGNFFRQGKHCRERWLNYLHPSIQNNSWSRDEDIKLLSLVSKKGKKWAKIAKKFPMTRSQSMVKKRFYELIKIDEQQALSSESLRKIVKKALDEMKLDMSSKAVSIKQNDKFEQEVDKNQRKSNISKEMSKIESTEKSFQQEMNARQMQQAQLNKPWEVSENRHFNSFTGFDMLQNPSYLQMSTHGIIQDGLIPQMGYGNYMGTVPSHLYSYYAQLIGQLQSGMIFNDKNQHQTGL